MAELNFGLLTPPGSQSIGNAFTQGMDQAQESRARDLQMQRSMRQDQLSEMQLQKTQRDEAALAKFYAHIAENGGPSDPLEIETKMIGSGIQKVVDTGLAARMKRLGVEQERKRFVDANAAPAAPGVAAPMAPAPGSFGADVATRRAADMFAPPPERTNMMPGAAAAPAGVNNLAALEQRIAANIALGTEQGYKNAEILRKQADALGKRYTVGNTLMGGEGSIYGTAPEKPPAPPSMVAEYTFAKTPDGGSFRGSYQDFVTARAAAGRAPRAEAPAVKPLTALQTQKAKETQVAQRSVVKSADTAANELETLADALLGNPSKKIQPDPGLGGITGFMGVLPSMPESQARSAQQKLDTFKGKVMAFGRLLAVQQGKLGNMAVSEWKFISDAIEKIDPAANNFNDQLRDVVRQAKDFAAAKRETFDELYDNTAPPGQAAPSSVAAALTPADQQALNWASANPKDPRANAIKQRLGR